MHRRTSTFAAALAAALLTPTAAGAHITVQPKTAPAGEFVRLDVRVPNERDDAGTRKVRVQFPPGVAFASWEPIDGWRARVIRRRAESPIEVHGDAIEEEIAEVTWTATGDTRVPPGAFQDFGLSVRVPDAAGETLTFKALQTYEGGEVVRWIGPQDADEPAPTLQVTAATEGHGGTGDHEAEGKEPAEATPAAGTSAAATGDGDDDGGSDGLAIAGIALGGLGLAAGATALATGRRRA